jgi:hypothetical protein
LSFFLSISDRREPRGEDRRDDADEQAHRDPTGQVRGVQFRLPQFVFCSNKRASR